MYQHAKRARRAAATGLLVVVLAATSACSGDTSGGAEAGAPGHSGPAEPSHSVGTSTTLRAKPVPLDIASVTVGDRLSRPRVEAVERAVGRVVGRYLDAAYLGEYPRRDFRAAFNDFADGTGAGQPSDRRLLTNAGIGASLESVTPVTRRVRAHMLVHRGVVAGVTAHVRLVFRQDRASGRADRVTVEGRLLLNRDRRKHWQIFGYDIARSGVPAAQGGRG